MTATITDNYFDLVRRLPLRPIRSRKEYRRASEMVDELAVRDEAELDVGERDYLAVLADLIEAYDERHHRLALSRKSPLQILKQLMKAAELRPTDLGRIIGSSTAASLILSGRRQLSKRHIIHLSDYFRVDPGLFLKP